MPSQPGSTFSPESQQLIIDKLKAEKDHLEEQKNQLESSNTQNQAEQESKDRILTAIKRQITEKDKEIEDLKKRKNSPQSPTSQNQNNNSSLVKWAIGLSIVAIGIGILAVILWLKPRKKTN